MPLAVTILLSVFLEMGTVFAASVDHPSRSDKDITAIGHRNIGNAKGLGNWYSLDKEKEIGKRFATQIEQSSKFLSDPDITEYVDRVAASIFKNSDAQLPITVRILDEDKVEAFTLPGGYQYVTRGLLLELKNEGELASVLARGIAHTALRSATRQMIREQYANIGTVPLILTGSPVAFLKFQRGYESAADYFGVQYVYKAGYSPESFSRIVRKLWPDSPAVIKAFNSFPPTSERLKALQQETAEILPKRDGEIVSTPEFEMFRARLHTWKPSEPSPIPK